MKNGWIWLPSEQYPNEQTTYYNGLDRFIPDQKYTVCALKKKYSLGARAKINIEVSGDTAFLLLCNEKSVLRGPAYSGGDFLDNDKPRKDYYSFKAEFSTEAECIELYALVRLTPYHICEYSRGQGGFFLCGTAELENGEKITLQLYSDNTAIEYAPTFGQKITVGEPIIRLRSDGRCPNGHTNILTLILDNSDEFRAITVFEGKCRSAKTEIMSFCR